MTRDAILRAAAQEIELNGMTLFRVKRVAYAAGISVGLLYSYFDDREDLIACAISHRFREVLHGLAETFTNPLMSVKSTEDLRQALRIIIAEAQVRQELKRAFNELKACRSRVTILRHLEPLPRPRRK